MENFKKNLPVILLSVCATLLLVAVILLINGNRFSFNNSTSRGETNENNTKTVKENNNNGNSTETNTNTNSNNGNSKNNTNTNNTNNNNSSSSNNNSTPRPTATPKATPKATSTPAPKQEEKKNNEENIPGDEDSVVAYFENISNMNTNDTSLSEKIKSGFVSIIDFIFYDKEIKGHTFKELTGTAKLKILTLALKIDNKIDSYFPGYKDRLSEKYKSVKEKIAELYAEYTVKVCETIGQENCDKLKDDFENMKSKFGIAGDYLKDAFSKASDQLRQWYENWRYK